jgi:hypothetical protein
LLVDASHLPIASKLSERPARDGNSAADLLPGLDEGQILLAGRPKGIWH